MTPSRRTKELAHDNPAVSTMIDDCIAAWTDMTEKEGKRDMAVSRNFSSMAQINDSIVSSIADSLHRYAAELSTTHRRITREIEIVDRDRF